MLATVNRSIVTAQYSCYNNVSRHAVILYLIGVSSAVVLCTLMKKLVSALFTGIRATAFAAQFVMISVMTVGKFLAPDKLSHGNSRQSFAKHYITKI